MSDRGSAVAVLPRRGMIRLAKCHTQVRISFALRENWIISRYPSLSFYTPVVCFSFG